MKILFLASLLASIVVCNETQLLVQSHNQNPNQNTRASNRTSKPKQSLNEVVPPQKNVVESHKNRYTNYVYGFSIPVPKGFAAYSSKPPAPDHGAGIDLSEDPATHLNVHASFNGSSYASLDELADTQLKWLQEKFPDAVLLKREQTQLSSLSALRLTMKYSKEGIKWLEISVVAFRMSPQLVSATSQKVINNPLGIVYIASLTTTEERFAEDATKFEEVIRGWKLRKAH